MVWELFCCSGRTKPSVKVPLVFGMEEPSPPSPIQNALLRPMDQLPLHYAIDWSLHGVLGQGHFAKVFFGQHLATQRKVAAKRILRSKCRTSTLRTEIAALTRLSHPNIMKLYDAYYDDVFCVLMLEYLAGGELFQRIVKYGAYREVDAAKHFWELCQACSYMHSHGVVHRDLKPENLILSEAKRNSPIKISDFGLAKIVDESSVSSMTTVCGTKAYCAPEVNFGREIARQGLKYSAKVDVWSMGVILYVLLGGYHPFDPYGKSRDDVLWQRVSTGEFEFNDEIWKTVSPQAKNLLREMIQVDVDQRLTMDQQ
ncbi:hypothetical protein BASA81_008320 [Batrachochytrium salamandrivorans]|nr:hypothetical protein BASA81_008320 [Batrachochytrium salamandrivorans]